MSVEIHALETHGAAQIQWPPSPNELPCLMLVHRRKFSHPGVNHSEAEFIVVACVGPVGGEFMETWAL